MNLAGKYFNRLVHVVFALYEFRQLRYFLLELHKRHTYVNTAPQFVFRFVLPQIW